jgi:bidirectional [NiFe] hydrogenase diaphorase subunit
VRVCPTGALFEKGASIGEMQKERGFIKFIVNARNKSEWVLTAHEEE